MSTFSAYVDNCPPPKIVLPPQILHPSYVPARDLLVVAYDENLLTDEELFLLYDSYTSENLDLPYYSYPKFDIDDLEDDECVSEFRFHKDLFSLAEALQILAVFKTKQRNVVDGVEGLCMLLRRFAYPCRYWDTVPRFARPVPVLSMITNLVMDKVFEMHSH